MKDGNNYFGCVGGGGGGDNVGGSYGINGGVGGSVRSNSGLVIRRIVLLNE